jgi:hypothetical protein
MKPSEMAIIALIIVQAAVKVFKLMEKWKYA